MTGRIPGLSDSRSIPCLSSRTGSSVASRDCTNMQDRSEQILQGSHLAFGPGEAKTHSNLPFAARVAAFGSPGYPHHGHSVFGTGGRRSRFIRGNAKRHAWSCSERGRHPPEMGHGACSHRLRPYTSPDCEDGEVADPSQPRK